LGKTKVLYTHTKNKDYTVCLRFFFKKKLLFYYMEYNYSQYVLLAGIYSLASLLLLNREV